MKISGKVIFLVILWFTAGIIEVEGQEMDGRDSTQFHTIDYLINESKVLSYVNSTKAAQYADSALELALQGNDSTNIAYSYRNLAGIYAYNENYYLASIFLQRALDIFLKQNDSLGIGNCYVISGHHFRYLNDRKNEVLHHEKSLQIFRKLGVRERISVAAHNLGESYYHIGEYDRSRSLTKESLDLNDGENMRLVSSCYKVLGNLALAQNDPASAREWYLKVLSISDSLGEDSEKIAQMQSMTYLGELLLKEDLADDGLEILNSALDFGKKFNLYRYEMPVYEILVSYYLRNNEERNALVTLQDFWNLNDEIDSIQKVNWRSLTQNAVELISMESEYANLQRESELQADRLQERSNMLIILILGSLVLIVLSSVLLQRNRSMRKQRSLIMAQKQALEKQTEDLSNRNQEKEILLKEIHHRVKNNMQLVTSFLDMQSITSGDKDQEMFASTQRRINSMALIHEMLYNTENFQKILFPVYAEKLVETLKHSFNLQGAEVNIDIDLHEVELDLDKSIYLGLLINEILTNSFKYGLKAGQPLNVYLHSHCNGNHDFKLKVGDNGDGIRPNASANGTSLGLILTDNLVKQLKGTMERSTGEDGTHYTITIPT